MAVEHSADGSGESERAAGSSSRSGTAPKKAPARKDAPSRTSADARPSAPGRAARGAWAGVSHAAGGTVRRVGATASDLEPEHRRDGLGFALLALGIIIAAREWWGLPGLFGDVVHAIAAGTFGVIAYILPVVCVGMGIHMFRHPRGHQPTNRMTIGLTILALGSTGIAHLVGGRPGAGDADGVRGAGGILGVITGGPLSSALTVWGAGVILALVSFFGFLVLTRTPVNRIPQRIREAEAQIFGHPLDERDDEGELRQRDAVADDLHGADIGNRARGGSRRGAGDDVRRGDEPYEQAAEVVGKGPRGKGRGTSRNPLNRRRGEQQIYDIDTIDGAPAGVDQTREMPVDGSDDERAGDASAAALARARASRSGASPAGEAAGGAARRSAPMDSVDDAVVDQASARAAQASRPASAQQAQKSKFRKSWVAKNKNYNFSAANDIMGIVMLEIQGAKDLPKLKNSTSRFTSLCLFLGCRR